MKYCVVFGSCSQDKTFYQATGQTIEGLGGKGANQAVALAKAGAKTILLTMLSSMENEISITNYQISQLKIHGVDTSHITFDPDHKNDVTKVTISENGENYFAAQSEIFNYFTVNYVEKSKEILRGAEFILLQMKIPVQVTRKIFEICKGSNAKVVLTPCRTEKMRQNMDIFEMADIVTCNQKEISEIFGNNGTLSSSDLSKILKKYPRKLIVTLGKEGVKYHNGKDEILESSIHCKNVLDTTGAGDTFCGNLVSCLSDGDDLSTAIKKAICASTIKIQIRGTQQGMPLKKERDVLFNKIYKGDQQ